MANERPAQVEETNENAGPATVEDWQDDEGNTNLPDNPAYAVPPVPQSEAKKAVKQQQQKNDRA